MDKAIVLIYGLRNCQLMLKQLKSWLLFCQIMYIQLNT